MRRLSDGAVHSIAGFPAGGVVDDTLAVKEQIDV
jgi:hypothetical protein